MLETRTDHAEGNVPGQVFGSQGTLLKCLEARLHISHLHTEPTFRRLAQSFYCLKSGWGKACQKT